eukprot:TRINITY_DN11606_c0_g1_i1.p1 TRINITY_DN11606_c0_g1~~TRINITY_DN11606_c0_g1_i1.p1  ORF type:complete len:459 (+),score=92.45 TRINITY_DN11606_c0_g1_i1:94-1470(+)
MNPTESNTANSSLSDAKDPTAPKHIDGRLLWHCTVIWSKIFAKALIICIPAITFLWIFFLPALILLPLYSHFLSTILYTSILNILSSVLFFSFVTIYAYMIYGLHLSQRAFTWCWFPGLFLSLYVGVYLELTLLSQVICFVLIFVAFLIVHHEKLPTLPSATSQAPTQALVDLYTRRTEISTPLAKMVCVVGLLFFLLRVLHPIFLDADLLGKCALRFIALPMILSCCAGAQLHFIKAAPTKHVEILVPVLWISNGMLKIFERLLTNSMFESGDYLRFAASALAASLIEAVSHASYRRRVCFVHRFMVYINNVVSKRKAKARQVSLVPLDSIDLQPQQKPEAMTDKEWVLQIRKALILEEIMIELIMVFVVTILLYFVSPLVANSNFETITTFKTMVIQLCIQLLFEGMSDVFGLYWMMSQENMVLSLVDVQLESKWRLFWVIFVLYQSLLLFQYLKS